MAKKPLPPKKLPGGSTLAGAKGDAKPPTRKLGPKRGDAGQERPEGYGKFDKFSTFALAVPCAVLGIVAIMFAVGYTHRHFDIGFFGMPKKTIVDWDSGSDAVVRLDGNAQIISFEQSNYIARAGEGEYDIALLNVGSIHNVNMGDVFTPRAEAAGARVELVVFDVQPNVSRAYILLGQNAEGGQRRYNLRDLQQLFQGTANIDIDRRWRDQIVRRYAEKRYSGN